VVAVASESREHPDAAADVGMFPAIT
jgi:hypothetical protein